MEKVRRLLETSHSDETGTVADLRNQANQIITPSDPVSNTTSQPSEAAHALLLTVVKSLFSKSQHPNLTQTGRKNLITQPSLPNRFGNDDGNICSEPSWKTPWTYPLLQHIINLYKSIPMWLEQEEKLDKIHRITRKQAVEDDFHLLTPAILHHLDDSSTSTKIQGCNLLHDLSQILISVQSEILRRTGLAEVFLDALKNCFHYIPSLTPEDESLDLMKSMYPAYLAVVEARCIEATTHQDPTKTNLRRRQEKDSMITILPITRKTTANTAPEPNSNPNSKPNHNHNNNHKFQTTHLTTLLRNSLLHTLLHLTTSSSSTPTPNLLTTTTSPLLTTYLLSQIPPILRLLGTNSSIHLQHIIPLLTNTLRDPFITTVISSSSSPFLVLFHEILTTLKQIPRISPKRVAERWWIEILRGVVALYLLIHDDQQEGEAESGKSDGNATKTEMLVKSVIDELKIVVERKEWDEVVSRLIGEEDDLRGLFLSSS